MNGESKLLRVVLDYDLLLADILWPMGQAPGILPLALKGLIQPAFCVRVLKNYTRMLSDPNLGLDPEDVVKIIDRINRVGVCVRTRRQSSVHGLNDWDRRLISCAVASNADALISLTPVRFGHGSIKNVSILNPADFAKQYMHRFALMDARSTTKMESPFQIGDHV